MSSTITTLSTTLIAPAESDPPASARALAIPELLENILIFLPMRDLLFAQAVNRTFQSVICNTRSLQELLFFRSRTPRSHDGSAHREVNPMLHPDHAPWFKAIHYVSRGSDGRVKSVGTSRNNCLIRPDDVHRNSHLPLDFFMRKEASWRRMLPTQPPPKSVWLVRKMPDILDFFGRRPSTDHDELLRGREGKPITMEEVYETARMWSKNLDRCEELHPYHVDIFLTCAAAEGREDVDREYLALTVMETRLIKSSKSRML